MYCACMCFLQYYRLCWYGSLNVYTHLLFCTFSDHSTNIIIKSEKNTVVVKLYRTSAILVLTVYWCNRKKDYYGNASNLLCSTGNRVFREFLIIPLLNF